MAKDSPVALETEWVTVGQSERLTNLGHSKTYELINNGTLESITIGRRRLIRVRSIRNLTSSPPRTAA